MKRHIIALLIAALCFSTPLFAAPGDPSPSPRLARTISAALSTAAIANLVADGMVAAPPSRAIGSLIGVTDASLNLRVIAVAASGVDSSPRAISNLVGRTDASLNLYVTLASGSVIAAPTFTGQALFANGTAALPSAAFTNSTTTGLYRVGADNVGFSAAGVLRWDYNTTRILSTVPFQGTSINMASTGVLGWSSTVDPTVAADTTLCRGAAAVMGVGGCTSSFPALKRNAAALEVKLADDSAFATIRGNLSFAGNTLQASGNNMLASVTAPSAPSSCGTSPVVTSNNGTASWVITGGTGGTATGCVVTMPGASAGWNCHVTNITQTAAHRADRDTRQTASTTTSLTFEYVIVSTGAATAFTASDVFRGVCFAY